MEDSEAKPLKKDDDQVQLESDDNYEDDEPEEVSKGLSASPGQQNLKKDK